MKNTISDLNEKIHLFELVNDASIDGIIVCDTSLKVKYWNKASELLTRITKEAAIGKRFLELFPELQSNLIVCNGLAYTLKGMKNFISYENIGIKKVYNEYHFIPLKDEDDVTFGVLIIIHDMSHRIKTENELKKLNDSLIKRNEQLKVKNAELAYFSKAAGYDLSEPLSRINSLAESLTRKLGGELGTEVDDYLKLIQRNAQKLSVLTESMQNYYEICSKSVVITEIDPLHVLLRAAHATSKNIDFKNLVLIPEELPVLQGDRFLLTLLFQHLISNAVKFQPAGQAPKLIITASVVAGHETGISEAGEGHYTRISFEDNGIGFDMNHLETIFMLFQRLNGDLYPGAGIGLAISKKVMEQHGGFITAVSQEGIGSTFQVFLPAFPVRTNHPGDTPV